MNRSVSQSIILFASVAAFSLSAICHSQTVRGTTSVDTGAPRALSANVANIEELYSAVNDPQNAGMLIVLSPGVYMLSVNDPGGNARPNSGRLELQENMSLQGVVGDRGAVVIDAVDLPTSSYSAPPIPRTGAIRMGRGTNSIEWLTISNAVNGAANIETELVSTGTTYIRVAHIASTNSQRGLDVRNFGAAMAGRIIEAEIVDNDLFNNTNGIGEGLRIVNNGGATGAGINATLSGNRIHNNFIGLIVEDNGSSLANISVSSIGDRFYENGLGALVGGGLSSGSNEAKGNTVQFKALGSSFENNNGFSNFDHGGLVVIAGENTSFPNGTSDNTVNVELRHCFLNNNQLYDLGAFGARSMPESVGLPGTNNQVKIRLHGTQVPVLVTDDSIPDYPEGMNSVMITRSTTPFDFDVDGRDDISVFRPSDRIWYLDRSTSGFAATQFGLSTDKLTPADLDGDGRTDISIFRNGVWYWLGSADGSFHAFQFGLPSDLPVPDDYTGDGRDDLAIYRGGVWWTYDLASGQATANQFGLASDLPVAADHDGDWKTDLTVFRPSTGYWYVLRSSDSEARSIAFGLSGDIPLKGDFNGDCRADLAVFRPSNGTWYIAKSTGAPAQNFDAIQFGLSTDIPAAADYDGDGRTDIAVYRNGVWYSLRSSSGFSAIQFGISGDKPIPSAFLP